MKKLLLIIILINTARLSYAQNKFKPRNKDSIFQSYVGKSYPEFNFTTTSGEVVSSKSTKGKIVLLNFWFKDCSPCRTEMEWLNALYDSLKTNPDVQFISVAREEPNVLPGYIDFFHLNYPVVSMVECDEFNLGDAFPKNIIIDKQGKIAYLKGGGSPDRAKAKEEILGALYNKIKELL